MQGMRDLLRLSLARSLRTLSEEDRLAAALPVVCGSAMAANCSVERLDDGRTLHLQVGREWLNPLLGMREVLQHDLARIAGVQLRDLHFEVAEPGACQRRAGATQPTAPRRGGLEARARVRGRPAGPQQR